MIQVSSNNGSVTVAMNHAAPLERSLSAIFKQKHPRSHLSDERIASAGQHVAVMALIYLLPAVGFSSGDSGLNQFPGDHAYHISELQGRKMVREGSLLLPPLPPLFIPLHFLISVQLASLFAPRGQADSTIRSSEDPNGFCVLSQVVRLWL